MSPRPSDLAARLLSAMQALLVNETDTDNREREWLIEIARTRDALVQVQDQIPDTDYLNVLQFIIILLDFKPELKQHYPNASQLKELHQECLRQVKTLETRKARKPQRGARATEAGEATTLIKRKPSGGGRVT